MNFLHYYGPTSILFSIGSIDIHWYGLLMAIAILAGLLVSIKIARWHEIKSETIYDLFFYVIIGGFIGARIFYILYNPGYFWQYPLDMFKIWQGGIAIHGALVFGILVIFWFARRLPPVETKQPRIETRQCLVSTTTDKFFLLSAIIAPGLALGQAIGRWGNYFNQEVFGWPTSLSWGIPINPINRPTGFEQFSYFHPTFLYESIGDLIIFIVLLLLHKWIIKHKKYPISLPCRQAGNIQYPILVTASYLLLYSTLRFFMEFLRIDPTAGSIGGVRVTMILAFLGVIFSLGLWLYYNIKRTGTS